MRIKGIGVANREVGQALEVVVRQGGVLSLCGSGHFKVVPPDKSKKVVFLPATPSDKRSMRNVVSKLRRAGFNL